MNVFTYMLFCKCEHYYNNDLTSPRIIARLMMLNGQEKYITYPENKPPDWEVFYLGRVDIKRIWKDEQGIFREADL